MSEKICLKKLHLKKKLCKLLVIMFIIILIILGYTIYERSIKNTESAAGKDLSGMAKNEMLRQLEKSGRFVTVSVKMVRGEMELPLELYVYGVVRSWIDQEDSLEYVKALCVLCRTEILRIGVLQDTLYQIPSSDFSKTYQLDVTKGTVLQLEQNEETEILLQAVYQTQGMIMTYEAAPIFCPFFALSAGSTRPATALPGMEELVYLTEKECPEDYLAEQYLQKISMSQTYFLDTLRIHLEENDKSQWIEQDFALEKMQVIKYQNSNYVKEVICNRQEELSVSGDDFRSWFALPSSAFTIQLLPQQGKEEAEVVIITKGIGHGFGLCLYQAKKLALKGEDYQSILLYFFSYVKFDSYA